jgi:hypothetical protein
VKREPQIEQEGLSFFLTLHLVRCSPASLLVV